MALPYPWPDFLVLALACFTAGTVRGFAGFGAAMIFMPLASTVVEPWRAVVLLLFLDCLLPLPMVPRALKLCTWSEVGPFVLGASLLVPVGGYLLISVDPTLLRWALSVLALLAVAALLSGWRYHQAPSRWISAGVGSLTGFLGGLASFYGPPMVLFWLGGQSSSATVRANIIVFFFAMTLVASASYAALGVLRLSVLIESLYLMPFYGLALFLGTRLYRLASERVFRALAYIAITLAALSSLPIF
ncbi:MAG: sulfite exporter TauE/SafE family protein [Rhodospirillales bacterium]